MVTRIMVVDDHPIVRSGLVALYESDPSLEVCGEAETIGEALSEIARTRPDAISLDLSLGEDSALSFFKELREENKQLRILCVSMHEERIFAAHAISEGADGYVHKNAKPEKILEEMHKVIRGEKAVSPSVVNDLIRPGVDRSKFLGLSRREFEVFQLIGIGKPTREIAVKLGISPRTVEAHKENIKKKLDIDTAAGLATKASEVMQGFTPNWNRDPGEEEQDLEEKDVGGEAEEDTEEGEDKPRGK